MFLEPLDSVIACKNCLIRDYSKSLLFSFQPEETSDGVSKSVHRVFASMMGENEEEEDEEEDEDEETSEQPTAGDVFALEMVLNRETKKMMKVNI